MDALMMPIVQAPKSQVTAKVDLQGPVGMKTATNFSDYMEKQMVKDQQGTNDLFGLQKAKGIAVSAVDRKAFAAAPEHLKENEDTTTLTALLGQFVQDLQKSAGDQKQGAGEWSFPVPDSDLMQKIAKDAGMNESQLSMLMEKMKNKDGKLNLVDFLASFSRHFQNLQNDLPVTVPETELPLLQNFLARLGIPVPEVSKISEAAVRGDNTIDLQKILAGLKDLPEIRITDITPVEAEQLQDLLAEAGVSQQLQRALLPERLPVVEGLVKDVPPVTLTLDRLKNMLAKAVDEVKANRLQADPLSFLADLQEVLVRSGFESKGPSLSSAVQGTVVAIFEKLMESVDLSRVKVIRGSVGAESMMGQKDLAVSAGTSEIDLQPLQSLLGRLGVSVPEMSRISDAAARGNNIFALQKVVDLLQGVMEARITDLTTEVNRISEAAVRGDNIFDLQKVADLLQIMTGEEITGHTVVKAEQVPVMKGLVESNQSVVLILDSLKNMLTQAVREVKANRLQTDPLSLLADLQEVLAPSGFATNGQRQSPVAQGSLVAVFEKLMASVDLSKVKVQQGVAKLDKAIAKNLGEALNLFADQNSDTVALFNSEFADPVLAISQDGQLAKDGKGVLVSGELFVENSSVFQGEAAVLAKAESVGVAASSSQAARPFVHIPNLPPGVQQQSFAQLSQGVLQGLRNQEHHLVLKLYPKEFGEVKVEMTVRDNQVAVSFLMENARVKAVLESNLEQFRENMEKQGFIIGDCMVSLNRDTDSNESWQQFQAASLEKVNGRRLTTLADLPEDILYQRVQPGNGRESGVDLFA